MKLTSSGSAAALTLVALGILAGCQKQEQSVAVPPSMIQKGDAGAPALGTAGETPAQPSGESTGVPPAPGQPAASTTTAPSAPAPSTINIPPTVPGDAVTLRLALQKGATMKYQSDTETTQSMGGKASDPAPKPIKSSSQTNIKVVDVTGGKSKVEMSVSNSKIAGGPDNAEVKKAMEKMSQDSNGVTVSVTFDSLAQPSNTTYVKGSKATAMGAGVDTETGFLGLSYPDKAVKPGDTWTHTFDFKNFVGQMMPPGAVWKDQIITTTFTLKSVDSAAGTAVVGISANGSPNMSMKMPSQPPKSGEKPKEPQNMSFDFKVTGTGFATIDLKTGAPKEITYEMNVNTKMPMGEVGQRTKATVKRVS